MSASTMTIEQANKLAQERIAELEAENKRLREEKNLIAKYLCSDPPFDACAGIDLHERAAFYTADIYAEESSPEDYYRAFIDCCKAALEPTQNEGES